MLCVLGPARCVLVSLPTSNNANLSFPLRLCLWVRSILKTKTTTPLPEYICRSKHSRQTLNLPGIRYDLAWAQHGKGRDAVERFAATAESVIFVNKFLSYRLTNAAKRNGNGKGWNLAPVMVWQSADQSAVLVPVLFTYPLVSPGQVSKLRMEFTESSKNGKRFSSRRAPTDD